MAVFNPEGPPANDPNYLRYAKVVEAPSPDKSKEIAYSTIGNAAAGAIGVADKFMQNTATNEARTGAESIQDIYTQVLKAAAPSDIIPQPVQTPAGASVGAPMKLSGSPSLMDSNASADMPDGVQDGIDRINTIDAARNSGKINDTYYTAQLTSLAKNLRAKYPGYRDYIDQEISHVTGMNPAKEYINNLMQDINQQRAQGQKVTDKILSEVLSMNSAGVDGAYDAAMHFMKTGDIAGTLKWMNTVKADSANATAAEQGLQVEAARDKQSKDRMENAFSVKADSMVNAAWSGATLRAGVDTPEAIQKMVTDKALGLGGEIDSKRMEAAALNIQAQRDDMETRLRAAGAAPIKIKMADGSIRTTTYSAELGPDRFNSVIAEKLKRFDVVKNGLDKGDVSLATYAATINQRVKQDYEFGVTTDPANKQLLAIDFLNKTAGPNWTSIVTTNALKADVDGVFAGLLRDKSVNAAAGPRPGQPAPSFKNDIEEAVNGKNTTNGKPIEGNTKYFDRLLDNVNLLATPTTSPGDLVGKKNIAAYFFDPRNIGTLSNFQLDVWDENGHKIPGRESVFRILSSPEISRSIKELGKTDPFIEKNYKDFIEYEWGQKIFQPQLFQMKDFLDGSASRVFTDPRGANLAFDRDTNQLQMIDNKGRPITQNFGHTQVERNYYDIQKRNLDAINDGLRNLTTMHKELGGDTAEYLIRTMENAGINVGSNKVGQAIVNSSDVAKKRFEEIFKLKAKEKQEEGNEPTLGPKGGVNQ